jgi:hypothetical protein
MEDTKLPLSPTPPEPELPPNKVTLIPPEMDKLEPVTLLPSNPYSKTHPPPWFPPEITKMPSSELLPNNLNPF